MPLSLLILRLALPAYAVSVERMQAAQARVA
jgi:hypothetical protein